MIFRCATIHAIRVGLGHAWLNVWLTALVVLGPGVQAAPGGPTLPSGALATAELDIVGLGLALPSTPIQIPQDAPFYVPVTLTSGGQPLNANQAADLVPAGATLQGTLSGPGLSSPVTVQGTLGTGLALPGLPQQGAYTLSGVTLSSGSKVLFNAIPASLDLACLGEVMLTQVTSSPMTLTELQAAGVQLQPGDYQGRKFEMVLAVGSQQISLSVPVAIPVYNGLLNPAQGGSPGGTLQIASLGPGPGLPQLSVVMADLAPPSDPFTLSRPELSFKLHNNFKAILVIPGSIGYLKQIYKVNVVVFNALDADSPYRITHLSATWRPPAGLDGQVGTSDDPLTGVAGEALIQAMAGADGTSSSLGGGQSASATFHIEGNREGSHPLDFAISGQFEGGDLQTPIALSGLAQGKVLVQNPTFSLMLVHPEVVRRGQAYTLEAHLTNTSQTLANAVSLTIDKAQLSNVQLLSDPTQQAGTLLPGQTAVLTFQLQSFVTGAVSSSYLYIDPGGAISFQLSTGVGPRQVTLNPDTLVLPDTLSVLPGGVKDAMVAVLSAAYDVATTRTALPAGVLPISRSTVTTTMAQNLSQEGLFLGMGLDPARVWWDLWTLFTQNPDPGFDQLMRTTQEGAEFRNAMLAAWSWADPQHTPAERVKDFAAFNAGLGNCALLGIQGAGPGVRVQVMGGSSGTIQSQDALHGLPSPRQGAAASGGLLLVQFPMVASDTVYATVTNGGDSDQDLALGVVSPAAGQAPSAANSLAFTLPAGARAVLTLGPAREVGAQVVLGASRTQIPPDATRDVAVEPFQVLGVHRYDLNVSPNADPYGTQVPVLFNRPIMALDIPSGPDGFAAASALVQVEANQFWQKVMAAEVDDMGGLVLDSDGKPVVPPAPPALVQAYPRTIACYLEKPVGPYVTRSLTLAPTWKDLSGNPIQGSLTWPIQAGLLPGGAIVKGHFRKLDGSGMSGSLSYWYQQRVDNAAIDLQTGQSFSAEGEDFYYPLVTNNVATGEDGSYQLDFVPAPIGDFIGPFVLQGGFPGGTAFAQASILGNGQVIQMDLVLEGKGSVDGYVLDADQQPIAGATVAAFQEQRSSDFTQGTGGGSFEVQGVSDAQGHYRLDGLKTGIFSLQALKGALGAATGGQIATDGQTVELDVVIQG